MRYFMFTLLAVGVVLALSDPSFAQHGPGYIDEPGNWWHWLDGHTHDANGAWVAAVPIPATLLLFGAGFAGFVAWRSRENRG